MDEALRTRLELAERQIVNLNEQLNHARAERVSAEVLRDMAVEANRERDVARQRQAAAEAATNEWRRRAQEAERDASQARTDLELAQRLAERFRADSERFEALSRIVREARTLDDLIPTQKES
jgi:hypothetical protein